MMATLTGWRDKLLGRGEAAITIPVLDGAFKPNRVLEDAAVLATLEAPEDLATDGKALFVADGNRVLRFTGTQHTEEFRADGTITALACLPQGGMAVAIDGSRVEIVSGPHDRKRWTGVNGKEMVSVNAISAAKDGRLHVTDGSATQPYERWCHDLMERGHTGRLLEFDPQKNEGRELKTGLHYAFGCCVSDSATWVSETWKHRILNVAAKPGADVMLDWLPGYPCRITPAPGGGFWLCAFAGRTQLVEFVLRENAFRRRMIDEVDPRYWIAPALNSGDDFLEPLQGAQVKMRGVLKPYAPPRSYGLVIRLDASGVPVSSFQSRLDGKNHGVVSAVEFQGNLFVLAKGSKRILQLPLGTA